MPTRNQNVIGVVYIFNLLKYNPHEYTCLVPTIFENVIVQNVLNLTYYLCACSFTIRFYDLINLYPIY